MDLLVGGFGSNGWSNSTYVYYILLILCCYVTSVALNGLQLEVVKHRKAITTLSISVPVIIMLLVKGFSICGVDVREGYQKNFYSATSWEHIYDWSLEVGYRFVNLVVRSFTSNYSVFLFIMAIMTLVPFWGVAKRHMEEIDVPIVIVGYISVFFFQGLSLVRIFIAANICLLSFSSIVDKKYVRAYAFIIFASLFHITAVLMIIPCLIYTIRIDMKVVYVAMVGAMLTLVVFKDKIAYLMSGRYKVYAVAENIDIGMETFCYYLPLIALWFFVIYFLKLEKIDKRRMRLFHVSFLWVVIGMMFSFASYIVPIFGRLSTYSIPVVFFVGVCMSIIKDYVKRLYIPITLIVIGYYFLRFQIYINGYYLSDGIMPYINCFGWSI